MRLPKLLTQQAILICLVVTVPIMGQELPDSIDNLKYPFFQLPIDNNNSSDYDNHLDLKLIQNNYQKCNKFCRKLKKDNGL